MRNKSILKRYLCLGLAAIGFVLLAGSLNDAKAQCNGDPFCTPSWKQPKKPAGSTTPGSPKPVKPGPAPVVPVVAPPIEQRIAFYKQQREAAVLNGQPIPKVTSVLTLDELSISGIFKTPRGYAAMVEATPIKLSYTIYPGEKFFDGQLVAIEENRAVFRKVTKMSNNKFITAVENKTLRQYTVQQEVQGTAPVQPQNGNQPATTGQTEIVQNSPQPSTQSAPAVPSGPIVSPVDEMNRQPAEETVKDKKPKKPVKTAKKS